MRNNYLHRKTVSSQPVRPAIRRAAKAVVGGVKAVGKTALTPLKWASRQVEKEWREEDEKVEKFRKKQKRKDLGLE